MKLLCVLLTALASQHAAAAAFDCFTVIDPRGEVVYKSNRTPIDLSKNISEAMAAAFPGHHLIWSQTEDTCVGVDRLPSREAPAADAQPAGAPPDADARAKPSQKAAARVSALRRRQAAG
ncbi:MAG TPA: hypothetical protein VIN58_02130 [Roseateles sp.]